MDIWSLNYDICESTSYTYGLNHVFQFLYFFLLQPAITTTYYWLQKVSTTENIVLHQILITMTTYFCCTRLLPRRTSYCHNNLSPQPSCLLR
jgi:hypothetical protein